MQDIRSRRIDLNLTQREAAGRAEMDEAAWSEIERGKREPRLHTLRRMVRALDMTEVEYLLASIVPRNGNGKRKARA